MLPAPQPPHRVRPGKCASITAPTRKTHAGSEPAEHSGPQFPHVRRERLHPGRWDPLPTVPVRDARNQQPKYAAPEAVRPSHCDMPSQTEAESRVWTSEDRDPPPISVCWVPTGGSGHPACTRWGPRAAQKPGLPHRQLQAPPPWVMGVPAPSAPARPRRRQGAVGRGGQKRG